jgi:hypothetical protein
VGPVACIIMLGGAMRALWLAYALLMCEKLVSCLFHFTGNVASNNRLKAVQADLEAH